MSTWQPGPRPTWVRALNEVARPGWLHASPDALLDEACARTGLSDFGGDGWREGFLVFVDALWSEARLNTVGAALARADVQGWLENRLLLTEGRKRNPDIGEEEIVAPVFITGLPRTGTSILHELLACDPSSRAPLAWEVRRPWPPPEASRYDDDPRIEEAERATRLWCDIVPEYDAMHEMGARLPVECIQITANSFRSDELAGRHVVPSYAAWLAGADRVPAYRCHRDVLQVLQWKHARDRWVLKAPSHLSSLDALLAVYPDARIVQTHRDPLKVIASVASILFSTAWVRSDAVDAQQVLGWFTGETCAALLDGAQALRDDGTLPSERVFDVRYSDLMRSPEDVIAGLYRHFGMPFDDALAGRIRAHVAARPRGRHGAHAYAFEHTGFDAARERERFAAYCERYGVAQEQGLDG